MIEIVRLALQAGMWLTTSIIEAVNARNVQELERLANLLPEKLRGPLLVEGKRRKLEADLHDILGE